MSSSMVTAQLNSYWSTAVDHTETRPRFQATLVRKSAVTKTHNVRPNLENDLANLMCHSRKMQNQTYLLEDKRKNAVATSQQLRNILRESEQPVDSSGISLERVKMNWKTFIVQYNGCLQRKLRMVKLVTLVKAKRVQIPAFHGMTDLQIRDKVRSVIKANIVDENNTQDEEELLPGN